MNPLRCEWHCTAPLATWPGCGRCGNCLADAALIFTAARRLLAENERYESALLCIDLELAERGQ